MASRQCLQRHQLSDGFARHWLSVYGDHVSILGSPHRLLPGIRSRPARGNGLRVYTTILIASLGGNPIAAGMEHYLYGWLVFALMTYLLFATCGGWREEPAGQRVEPGDVEGSAPLLATASISRTVLFATVALLVVGIAPLSARLLWPPLGNEDAIRANPPEVSLPWQAIAGDLYAWTPRFSGPSTEFVQSYRSGPQCRAVVYGLLRR